MTTTTFMQTTFFGGEWSPEMGGRTDHPLYKHAMSTSMNYRIAPTGAAVRRSGTLSISETHTGAVAHIAPFVYSRTEAYGIELTNVYMRFIKNRSRITTGSKTIIGISTANPAVLNVTAHGYSTADRVIFPTLVGADELRARELPITVIDADHFSVAINGAFARPFVSGTVAFVYGISSPFPDVVVPEIRYVQDNNKLLLFHKTVPTQILTRAVGADTFTITALDYLDGPYFDAVSGLTIVPGGISGSITLTIPAVTGVNNGQGFLTTDVNRLIRLQDSDGNWTWAQVTARNTALQVVATLRGPNLKDTSTITNWQIGLYSQTTGYPAGGTFHEGRLWIYGEVLPNRVDAMRTNVRYSFEPTTADDLVVDDDAIAAVFDSKENNSIEWANAGSGGLSFGTLGGMWQVRASQLDDPITPTSAQARQSSVKRAANVESVGLEDTTVFVEAFKRRLWMYPFGAQPVDASYTSRHLTTSGIDQIVLMTDPSTIIWGRMGDGTMVSIGINTGNGSLDMSNAVFTWGTHVLGTNANDAVVESMMILPEPDGLGEDLWMVVKRTVNGVDVRRLEYMTDEFDDTFTPADGFFVDGGRRMSDDPNSFSVTDGVITIYGLHDFEGDTVTVTINGFDMGDFLVASGSVSLSLPSEINSATASIVVGYNFTSTGALLRPEDGLSPSPAVGKKRKIDQFAALLYRTGRIKFSTDDNSLKPMPVQSVGAPLNEVALFSGVYRDTINDNSSFDGKLKFEQDRPAPGMILSLTGFVSTQEK